MENAIEYHSGRAAAEMDRGLRAACPEAAQSHFGLSSLHLEEVRELQRHQQVRLAA